MKGARYGYSTPNTQLFYDNNYKNYYPTGYNIIVTYEDKYRKIPVYCKMELGKFNRAVFSMKVKKASEKIQNAVDRFGDLKHGPCAVTYDSKGIRIWCDDFDKVSGYIEL